MKLLVGSIQRLCIHDGPGIRTTVFLKGCQLRCPWCGNPENMERSILVSQSDPARTWGSWMEGEELLDECMKDASFYGKNGGVTFSGGEPLLWGRELVPLVTQLRSRGVSSCVETSLFAPSEHVEATVSLLGSIFVDVKILDATSCRQVLGGHLDVFLRNLSLVEASGIPITYRFPLAKGYSFVPRNQYLIKEFMKARPDGSFEVFRCHNLAAGKYNDLGIPIHRLDPIDENEYRSFLESLRGAGIHLTELTL